MREPFAGFLTGLIFGLGLCLANMTDPAVVLGFLDIAGAWNPALAFVMAAGVAVTFIGYRIVLRGRPLWAARFQLPTAIAVDRPLIAGAALFGVGWGLAGYCPGPAIVSLASGRLAVVAFVIAMLAGMVLVRWLRGLGSSSIGRRAAGERP